MIHFRADMFLNSDAKWQELYASGLRWCPNGIQALEYSGVSPYHLPVPLEKRNEDRQVVYAIYNQIDCNKDAHYFFEDDYKEAFAIFNSLEGAVLAVSYLKNYGSCPKKTWANNQEYMMESHSNLLRWSKKFKSWCF